MKKLLFFDIECSNCYGGNGKVCEFGAVLTDENFNIISEYDLPMCPGKNRDAKFDMTFLERNGGYSWAYEIEDYMECPEFNEYYELIRKLIEDKDTMVFGYAVDNDIRYLSSSISRYKLKQLDYRAYDSQLMFRKYGKLGNVRGLNATFINLCGENAFKKMHPHLSRDDARMTMMVVKAMCENLGVSVSELIDLCSNCCYDSLIYLEAYKKRKQQRIEHPELISKRNGHVKSECQVLWGDFYREHLPLLENESCIGNIVAISSALKKDYETILNTIDAIKRNNLVAYDKINGSDYLVVLNEEDKNRIESILKYPYNGTIILYKDFVKNSYVI